MPQALELTELQRIPTSGARAVEPITVGGLELLAVPQLAYDVEGDRPNMNGGDSDTEVLLLQRVNGRFEAWGTLAGSGGEDAEFFTIGDQAFLAVASLRTGDGPYEYSTESPIYTWHDGAFAHFQSVPTFAAKQWKHWRIGARDFLGLAQGVRPPGSSGSNRDSVVYEWDGAAFVEHQHIASQWAYNWHAFTVDGATFVAHADHLDASVLYRWDGERLVAHQDLAERGGRAFATWEADDDVHLLVATLLDPPKLMRWDGERFVTVQTLEGLGARELAVVHVAGQLVVVRVNFILGTPADPTPALDSQLYVWEGGGLVLAATFATCGGTDVAVVGDGDEIHLAVSNGLSADVRFATDTLLYSLAGR